MKCPPIIPPIIRIAICLLPVLFSSSALAYIGDITSTYISNAHGGPNTDNCSLCHAGNSYTYSNISFTGCNSLEHDSTATCSLGLNGSNALKSGINLSVYQGSTEQPSGLLSLLPGNTTLRLVDSNKELAHTNPLSANTKWEFRFTAPASPVTDSYQLWFCINQVNNNGNAFESLDGPAVCESRTVTVTNSAPNAVNDSVATNADLSLTESASVNFNVLSNDSDSDSFSVSSFNQSSTTGSVTNNGNGSFTYNTNGQYEALAFDESTTDNFTYTIQDSYGASDAGSSATVTLNIKGQNDRPIAVVDSFAAIEGGSQTFNLVSNDTDVDNNANLTVVSLSSATNGSLINNNNGSVTYTHNGSETSLDSFTYQVSDGLLTSSNTATVSLSITAVNDPPTAMNDRATVNEGNAINIKLIANDSDPESDPLTIVNFSTAVYGSISSNGSSITYTHDGSETLKDSFTYQVSDGVNLSNSANVSLSITPVNDAPVAVNDMIRLKEGDAAIINLTSNDTDAENDNLSVTNFTAANNGDLIINKDGTLTYTHNGSETTTDTFTYQVNDGNLDSLNSASVSINIAPVNDAPVISQGADTNVNLSKNANPIAFSLTLDATDAENDTLSWSTSDATNGTASVSGTGNSKSIRYTPDTNFSGSDSFIIRVSDANSARDSITINLSVENTDNDNDGIINSLENQFGLDPNSLTTISLPATLNTPSSGYTTPINPGIASASDNSNSVNLSHNLPDKGLRPGMYNVQWRLGNILLGTQVVNVLPQANFGASQQIAEGNSTQIIVQLNGTPAAYPVILHYSVSGTADSSDYTLSNNTGTLTINTPDTSAQITLTASATDADNEPTETLTLTLSNPTNAVIGNNPRHDIYIFENNIAPKVSISVTQNAMNVVSIYKDQGNALLSANATDPGDTLSFNWSNSDNALIPNPPTSVPSSASVAIDPSNLNIGTYLIDVKVSDGLTSTRQQRMIRVIETAPNLTGDTNDSDADGTDNSTEGFADADNDLIPDYLDANSEPELLPNQTGDASNQYLIQTEPGLLMQTGQFAIAAGRLGSLISPEDIINFGGINSTTTFSDDEDHIHFGGIYDFSINNVIPGNSAMLVIPLQNKILNGSIYHKYNPTIGWQVFSLDANNAVYSAEGKLGSCPAPGSNLYTTGLTPSHYCVQLKIQDGGPNDTDGLANGTIQDPGSIAIQKTTRNNTPAVTVSAENNGSIGLLNPLLLCLFTFVYILKNLKEKNNKRK